MSVRETRPGRGRPVKARKPAADLPVQPKGRAGAGALRVEALEGAVEGVLIAGRDSGMIRFANASAGRMFGCAPADLQGESIRVLHPEGSLPAVLERFDALGRGETNLVQSVPCLRRDGAPFWADVSSARLALDGETCLIGFFTDVSDRKAARDANAEAQALFSGVFNAVPDILGIQDACHGIIRYNEAGYRFLNTDADGVKGRKCFELIGRTEPCPQCATAETYRTKRPAQIEKFLESMGIWLDVRAYPIFDSHGDLMGIVEHLRDITLQKRAEAELIRTEKLSSLAILAGGIAHDFNNLLGGIYGNIDMARTAADESQARGFLDVALKTIGRARSLTQQLLTFAKGGAPVRKAAALGDFLRQAASFACSGSATSCTVDIEPGLWACDYDADQLAQVVDNILINAQQAMPGGGVAAVTARNVTLGVSAIPSLAAGRYVLISFRDEGVGIPPENLPRVFDPFFTSKQQGSGLGLTTSFSIVRQHGGHILVESEPGRGSMFHVYLPACELPAPAASTPEADHATGERRILIMDDEEMLRETIGAMLRHHGYETVLAADGAEALRIFDAAAASGAPFAAAILDLTVPGGMGGRETIKELRRRDPDLPVFVASGYASDPILANPREYGFTDSIVKPFTRKALIEILCKYF